MGDIDRYTGGSLPLPRKLARDVSRSLAETEARDAIEAGRQRADQQRRLREQQHTAHRTAAANGLIREVVQHSREQVEDDPLVASYVAQALDRGVSKIIDQI